jgi:formylmethanofuran dehydrogenase subunit E
MEISEKIKKIETYCANKMVKTVTEYLNDYHKDGKSVFSKTIFNDNKLYLILYPENKQYSYKAIKFELLNYEKNYSIFTEDCYIRVSSCSCYLPDIKTQTDDEILDTIKTFNLDLSSYYATRRVETNLIHYDEFLTDFMRNVFWLSKCSRCGKIHLNHTTIKNEPICIDCLNKYYRFCDVCGSYHKKEEMTVLYDDSVLCNRCLNNTDYVISDALDENHKILKRRSILIPELGRVCKKSIKEHKNKIVKCSLCGDYVKVENSKVINKRRICSSCLSNKHTEIKSYHSNPKRVYFYDDRASLIPRKFKGFGIELEVQKTDGGSTDKAREEIKKILGDDPYQKLYFMRDGSIGSAGFEMITQPHSERDLLKIDWESILSKLTKLGYRSHNGNCCGLHIHSSRSLYGDTKEEQDDNIAKVIYFYEKNFDELFKFSRRTDDHWCKPYKETLKNNGYLSRLYGYTGEMSENVCKSIVRQHRDRYQAVNVTNKNTIEFRIFRGTLCLNSFLSALDLTFNIVRNCKNISWEDVDDVNKWLAGINDTTKNYIKRRNCFTEVIR